MTYLDHTVSQQFIKVGSRALGAKTKAGHIIYILYPVYMITIDNSVSFEYSSSAMRLQEMLKLNSPLYEIDGEVHIYQQKQRNYIPIKYADNLSASANLIKENLKTKASVSRYLSEIANSGSIKTKMNEFDLKFAFRSILDDALTSTQFNTPGELAKEFGVCDVDEAIRIFSACEDTYRKLRSIGIREHNIEEMLDQMVKDDIY